MWEWLVLGTLAWLSLAISWYHLPDGLKRFSIKHFVITDALATGITWLGMSAISHSLVAVAASAVCGLLMNFTMMALSKPSIQSYVVKGKTHV